MIVASVEISHDGIHTRDSKLSTGFYTLCLISHVLISSQEKENHLFVSPEKSHQTNVLLIIYTLIEAT